VHFKPGGAFPFLDLPEGELHNAHLSLDALWGPSAGILHERLVEARTQGQRFQILEQCLLARAVRPLARHPAVAFALSAFQGRAPARTVGDVTTTLGLSPRRFIEVFTREVGLTPKLFARIQRFQNLLWTLNGHASPAWADLALACGYYDQAHFIRDFRSFSGLNPSGYYRKRGDHLNHVPLAE
jgi:AraC-like DNA-binding protein